MTSSWMSPCVWPASRTGVALPSAAAQTVQLRLQLLDACFGLDPLLLLVVGADFGIGDTGFGVVGTGLLAQTSRPFVVQGDDTVPRGRVGMPWLKELPPVVRRSYERRGGFCRQPVGHS